MSFSNRSDTISVPPLAGLGQLLPRLAARWQDRAALVTEDRTLSYDELNHLASQVAHGLTRRGVQEGDRVSLLSQNRWEWIAAYHGVLRCGAVVNPLNVMLTGEELVHILNDSGAKVLMASRERLEAVSAALQDASSLSRTICFDEGLATAESFVDMLGESDES